MNRWTRYITLTLALLVSLTAVAEDGAKIMNLDASGGASAGHMVVFVANQTSENTMAGTAYVAFMNKGKFEGAYGLHTEGDTSSVGDVSGEVAKKTTNHEDPKATITHVDVTAEQYAKAKAAVKKYQDTKEHLDEPGRVAVNCAVEVMGACGMKYPYRSGLRPPNPTQFFGDIGITNRKMVKE